MALGVLLKFAGIRRPPLSVRRAANLTKSNTTASQGLKTNKLDQGPMIHRYSHTDKPVYMLILFGNNPTSPTDYANTFCRISAVDGTSKARVCIQLCEWDYPSCSLAL
jgi:hypothetical protein